MNEIKSGKVWSTHVVEQDGRKFVEIPSGIAASGEVTIRQDGNTLIVEPLATQDARPASWAEFFDNLEPVDLDWPDIDEGLLPNDDIDLLK